MAGERLVSIGLCLMFLMLLKANKLLVSYTVRNYQLAETSFSQVSGAL